MSFLYEHENKISFRKMSKEDLPPLADLKNENWFGTHRISIVNLLDQERWYESLSNQSVHVPLAVVLMAHYNEEGCVGVFKILNICWQNRRADVGWDIFKVCRGKGLGKKLVKAGVDFSFEMLNLHRLRADILETNAASQRCAEGAGFAREGTEKSAIWKRKEWVDSHIYGIVNVISLNASV